MAREQLRPELPVFAHDGEIAFGAVRAVYANDLTVYIENTGDVSIPMDAVTDVHFGKVLLDVSKLSDSTRAAILRAHSSEGGS